MISLLLVLNGFLLAFLVSGSIFVGLYSLKLYRRFFTVLNRKIDAVDNMLLQCKAEVSTLESLKEDIKDIKRQNQFNEIKKVVGKK